MNDETRKILIAELMKSDKIQKLYDEYIIKDITFKEWISGRIDLLMPV